MSNSWYTHGLQHIQVNRGELGYTIVFLVQRLIRYEAKFIDSPSKLPRRVILLVLSHSRSLQVSGLLWEIPSLDELKLNFWKEELGRCKLWRCWNRSEHLSSQFNFFKILASYWIWGGWISILAMIKNHWRYKIVHESYWMGSLVNL